MVAALLPLRAFLGVTMVYAGLQKLLDRSFFKAGAPGSIQLQLRAASHGTPLHAMASAALHQPVGLGILIALAELGIGLGTLLGLYPRAAAIGGAVLSAIFLLTVSWHTQPYYYGSDIVFLFAWMPLAMVGTGGVLSLEDFIAERVHATVPAVDAERRTFVARATAATAIAVAALGLSGGLAAAARLGGRREGSDDAAGGVGDDAAARTGTSAVASRSTPTTSPPTTSAPSKAATTRTTAAPAPPPPPAGRAIGSATAVPVGGSASFIDPYTGRPALVMQPAAGRFMALSAVCTHAGCRVRDYGGGLLECPCHGAEFDASTGNVLRGPARTPLPRIPVEKGSDGQLYVQA